MDRFVAKKCVKVYEFKKKSFFLCNIRKKIYLCRLVYLWVKPKDIVM
jgi:hypothetical protein